MEALPVLLTKFFFLVKKKTKTKFPVWGILSSSARLSGFLNYWMVDERNFAVLNILAENNLIIVCSLISGLISEIN